MRRLPVLLALLLSASDGATQDDVPPSPRTSEGYAIPAAPETPDGALPEELEADLEALVSGFEGGAPTPDAVRAVARHGDPRVGWLFVDLLRFGRSGPTTDALVAGFQEATGVALPVRDWVAVWKTASDFLIAWDLPAAPGFAARKARLYTSIEPAWAPFFADAEADIDWRRVTWGGVFVDDRPLGVVDGCPRGCIPALDDPGVTDAAGGRWYLDHETVFGVTIGGESRAYPKHQMEAHEMVLDTLGGRRIALPYCTLCASAQAYLLDGLPEGVATPILRTSGLLSRSNKMMYDLVTDSMFDTFTGAAVSGPLRERGVRLEQVAVVTTTWGRWRRAHPDTTIVREDGGVGRRYLRDPLEGRDDQGPVFPVGDVDPRLPVQQRVVGVLAGGAALAFHEAEAFAALERGEPVALAGVSLVRQGGGLAARDPSGEPLPSHGVFWFAWSQFHPSTALWRAPEGERSDGPRSFVPESGE